MHKHPHSVLEYCGSLLLLFLFLWLRNKICFAVVAGTKITRFLTRNNEQQNISFQRFADGNTRIYFALEHYVCLLPSLVVHHHLTRVILIGIIFISQILQWSLVIEIILNNFNFSFGSRTSMVHQNTTQSSISYP